MLECVVNISEGRDPDVLDALADAGYRDLADRTRWIERYHVPTWLDYVRHNQRRTRADAVVTEELRRLHRGEWPPPVARMLERDISATLGDRLGNILPGLRQVHW